ncbi:hypothetical protein BDY19DRAFT_1067684 [Irpex rosettiformis]|uniref:Uncharacterized protein n=1 Tax=Irpex rosettiformis TaxID=378272 RepID=A0ACB8UAG7_9APHY|nr:hypothetical protein BDY19DRAFT_1067684 [Irpex rosettiformis]
MDRRAESHLTARRNLSELAHPRLLPRYSRASFSSVQSLELLEHSYTLPDSKGRPFITLHVKSRAKDKRTWPLFCERDTIRGTVEVDFDKTDGAKAVSITLAGGVTAVGQEELNFLTSTKELWNAKVSGNPPNGKMSWPFTIPIPTEVDVADKPKAKAESYRLPPTFSERASPAYIDYKLVITVKRSALRVNQIMTTSIYYTPLSRADPPSALRQAAYVEGSSLAGPDRDPEGWKTLSQVRMGGTLFKSRTVNVDCTVSLANPLSYAAGSPIPIIATFNSDDQQALDLICSPTAVKMALVRERLIGLVATRPGTGSSANVVREVMCTANFWPTEEGDSAAREPLKRTLRGELDIRKAYRPTFTFPAFSLRYDVCMYPSQAPGFVGINPDTPLFAERVMIHTLNAVGVIPKSFAPPGYSSAADNNWNVAAGFLENGNQRRVITIGPSISCQKLTCCLVDSSTMEVFNEQFTVFLFAIYVGTFHSSGSRSVFRTR